MNLIGNILWIILGGVIAALGWFLVGIIYCITIIGIPFGIQAFKIGLLTLAPFGVRIRYGEFGAFSFIGNIIWIIFGGIELAILHLVVAGVLAITIIGIPFALQHLKLAKLALLPFGSKFY